MKEQQKAAAGRIALCLHWNEGKLASIDLDWNSPGSKFIQDSERACGLQEQLEAYTQGVEPFWPELPFDYSGLTPFRRQVLETLYNNVGWGESISYGELASLAGFPRAARAVGGAMASNPFPLIIPCHRVLGSNGSITGFSGCGPDMKKHLLAIEGIHWK